ncbi:hybrid sensor histidine kinase/response regulator [Pseudoalteromonas obscura]|uniref:histidine kinase n=1 Tax=Pseudoalteromonas obscura TaxID=3048491 RepID=A0ABT7EQ09_9GAMM|nr:hybrid sensor histidine kinase/response regulator [Pseudoalteromonas sp. P94(2023)]MDK2597134.1 response regulator [Pseudoalteromonas sp. P94(2023)]
MQILLSQQAASTYVINTAGMQRMLSQKAALLLGAEYIREHPGTFDEQQMLRDALDKMAENQAFLLAKSGGRYAHLSSDLQQFYFQPPVALATRVEEYIDLVKTAHSLALVGNLKVEKLIQVQSRANELLIALDQAVTLHELVATNKVKKLQNVELFIWLFGLMILIIEARWIFYPMEKSIQKKITRLQTLRIEANRLKRSKSEFLARASHEMRTPLQAVMGYLALFKESAQPAHLEVVEHAAKQLNILLSAIDDYNVLSENKEIKLDNKTACLFDTLSHSLAIYKPLMQQKSLSFTTDLGAGLSQVVECDHNRLAWLVGQILDNAVKYTEYGEVRLEADCHQRCEEEAIFHCLITDTGPGINQTQAKIDEEENYQGMQLGLTRAQLIINMLGGEMSFTENIPTGTQVLLEIPVKVAKSAALTPFELSRENPALLVEDNLLNARVVVTLLEKLGLSVIHVVNGQEALSELQKQEFSLVLMDLNMPVMDGFTAIKMIRHNLGLELPILVLTANTTEQAINRVYELGANAHLFKPVDLKTLREKVELLITPSVVNDSLS